MPNRIANRQLVGPRITAAIATWRAGEVDAPSCGSGMICHEIKNGTLNLPM
jgi:hypothetical protein